MLIRLVQSDSESLAVLSTPTFSPVAGSYSSTQSITLSDSNSGVAGFAMTYTVDGTTPIPGSHGTVYSIPITVSSSQTIKVIASATGWTNSSEADATYTINTGGGSTNSSWETVNMNNSLRGLKH